MRKASIIANHQHFEARLTELENLSSRVLQANTGLTAQERGQSFEGFALLLAGYWEELVNDNFVDALNRDTSRYAQTVGISLPRNLPRDVCFGLLMGYGYLDFRNVGELMRRAQELLVPADNPLVKSHSSCKSLRG